MSETTLVQGTHYNCRMESLKRAIGSGGEEGGGTTTWFGELTGATNESCCPSMSYKQVCIIVHNNNIQCLTRLGRLFIIEN